METSKRGTGKGYGFWKMLNFADAKHQIEQQQSHVSIPVTGT
jgi:hypothetical protein